MPHPSPSNARIARRLIAARGKRTQLDVAQALGVDRGTIRSWETGLSSPKATDLVRLVEIYGCSADWLLGRDIGHEIVAIVDADLEAELHSTDDLEYALALLPRLSVRISDGLVVVPDKHELAARIAAANRRIRELQARDEHRGTR
jgi:transcriptional regulator with XRE-family HTH domain